jgi:hypothetical protein
MKLEEQRQLAWDEFSKQFIDPLDPAKELAYKSLFFAGYNFGYVDAYKEHDTLEPLVIG